MSKRFKLQRGHLIVLGILAGLIILLFVIKPPERAKVSLAADPPRGPAPLKANLTANAKTRLGVISKYQWDFEDDGKIDKTTTTNTVSYTYSQPGEFKARVKVLDNKGTIVAQNLIPIKVEEPLEPKPIVSEDLPPGLVKPSPEARQHLHQGMIYVSLAKANPNTAPENYKNAEEEYKRAIGLSPNWGVGYANLGLVYMQQRKFDLALLELKKAAELEPKDPMIHYNLAALYSLQNKLDLALDELDKALEYGFKNYDSLRPTGSESDPDLNNLRRHPEFRQVLEKHKVFISG